MPTLRLTLTDYVDATRWRWVLSDQQGRFLADHDVRLDPTSRQYGGFLDLTGYLDYYERAYIPEAQLADLGAWVGECVFGGLRDALWRHRASPAVAVQVTVPQEAGDLLLRPFELACFTDGTRFREAGVRFVYQFEDEPGAAGAAKPAGEALRILAAFSLPERTNPLNLRRERHSLERLVRELSQTRGLAIELRVLQYGATRDILQDALEEGEGWDVVHLSGHGLQGEVLLEDEVGGTDTVDAGELGALLDPARARLKLLILDACYSGAGSHADARAQVGLDRMPTRREGAEGEAVEETTATALPSLAQALSQRLDCAVLAMRYPVGDAFATDLMLSLYEKLLARRQTLPAALHLALEDVLEADIPRPPLAAATPILVGQRAAELLLPLPRRPAQALVLPEVGLGIAFPQEPERFVGRLQPMLRASQALAPRSAKRGVLFHGMPGAGKTTCALELAYRHAVERFRGYVWYRGPEAGSDVSAELFNVLFEAERQLNAPGLGLTTALDEPERFRRFTLPRLGALLQQNSLLLVLDNLETLLTGSNQWRDPLWGDVVAALLGHGGPSRVVLTSWRLPADLEGHAALQVEAIHALSFAESVLLARELPNLRRLFEDKEGLALLRETLRVVQGHPKLLELADSLAVDREALAERVAAAAADAVGRADVLDAFFAVGGEQEGETQQEDGDFVGALQGWTERVVDGLSPTAELLLTFLCRLEPEDRQQRIVEANWEGFLNRLGEGHATAAAALGEGEQRLPGALEELEGAGLVAVEHLEPDEEYTTYTIHPGVVEAVRAAAGVTVLDAADTELGDFLIAVYQRGRETEMEGGGGTVTAGARRAAPYLLRQARWQEASTLLEQMLQRDSSPASLVLALPLLRRIAGATAGSDRELIDAGILARTLRQANRTAEAEEMLRDLMARAVAQRDYRTAATASGEVTNLLVSSGRLTDALRAAEETVGYTRHAGLGPWTQLAAETNRLQVLVAMGRNDEVLAAVERLRPGMETLPQGGEEETAHFWNVRESLLDTGRRAALHSGRWETALELNVKIVELQRARGAGALELMRRRFNDYGPLLRLDRTDEARAVLKACRAVFEVERDVAWLGRVYGALAHMEERTDDRAAAVRFQEVALRYSYQAGQPEDCAIGHGNLAEYLKRQDAGPSIVLVHHLAAAAIRLQTRSGRLSDSLHNLAISDLPHSPPAFDVVVEGVEAVEGVRFRALFERLPRTAPDGDAALAAVWHLVAEEKGRRDAVLALLPPSVRAAFELEGEEAVTAMGAALAGLPGEQAEAILQQLLETGLVRGSAGPDMEQVLREFEPLLQGIAAAVADESRRREIEPELADLEERGWMLREAARRIWAGERDEAALTEGLDEQDSALVCRVLQLLKA